MFGANMHRLFIFVFIAATFWITTAAFADVQRGLRNYQEILAGRKRVEQLSPVELQEVLQVHEAVKSQQGGNTGENQFEVVAAVRGCKYFVVEQGVNYSLVEDWLCSRPRRGDTGYGNVNSYGIKEVNLDGSRCSIYVDDWMLSKSRALEKMADKCQ
jgi:hypothetical protein